MIVGQRNSFQNHYTQAVLLLLWLLLLKYSDGDYSIYSFEGLSINCSVLVPITSIHLQEIIQILSGIFKNVLVLQLQDFNVSNTKFNQFDDSGNLGQTILGSSCRARYQ